MNGIIKEIRVVDNTLFSTTDKFEQSINDAIKEFQEKGYDVEIQYQRTESRNCALIIARMEKKDVNK